MLREKYALAMKTQAFYALLCIVWNGVVIWQLQSGTQPIGPTGSTLVIAGAVIFVVLLAYSLHLEREVLYILLAAVVSMLAMSAVWSSVTSSSDAWPSQFWWAMGLSINGLGVFSFVVVTIIFIRGRPGSSVQ